MNVTELRRSQPNSSSIQKGESTSKNQKLDRIRVSSRSGLIKDRCSQRIGIISGIEVQVPPGRSPGHNRKSQELKNSVTRRLQRSLLENSATRRLRRSLPENSVTRRLQKGVRENSATRRLRRSAQENSATRRLRRSAQENSVTRRLRRSA